MKRDRKLQMFGAMDFCLDFCSGVQVALSNLFITNNVFQWHALWLTFIFVVKTKLIQNSNLFLYLSSLSFYFHRNQSRRVFITYQFTTQKSGIDQCKVFSILQVITHLFHHSLAKWWMLCKACGMLSQIISMENSSSQAVIQIQGHLITKICSSCH